MPLTPFQARVAKLLSSNRSIDSHLAGGAAIHLSPQSKRFSNDLDYFHDSVARVLTAFSSDEQALRSSGYSVTVTLQSPGFVRAIVSKEDHSTKVEWSHDSAWRFLPVIRDDNVGFVLHPVDLAVNKILALAGRVEARDYYDTLQVIENVIPLGALVWGAAGKDPGYTPQSLLDVLRRRGKYRPEDFAGLDINETIDLPSMKKRWITALDEAEQFINVCPIKESGCLYYSGKLERFVMPRTEQERREQQIVCHFGRPGGVLPVVGS